MVRINSKLSKEEFERQIEELREQKNIERELYPHAKKVWYEEATNKIMVELNNDILIGFPCSKIEELSGKNPDLFSKVTLSPYGDALIWEDLDIYINLLGLISEVTL